MKSILFIDEVCPKPYSFIDLLTTPMGGTEATVIRIADALAHTNQFQVYVEQHNRTEDDLTLNTKYLIQGKAGKADYVVCLRDPKSVERARSRFPNAKIYLWSHDLPNQSLGHSVKLLKASGCLANITVSQYHQMQSIELLKAYGYQGEFKVLKIYNPIEDRLIPDDTVFNPDKLSFVSSPHKGLGQALQIFKNLRNFNPKFELHVTNPGYFLPDLGQIPGVIFHGPMIHADSLQHVRESLCLFYPNTVFPETFGLVMAESDAVGTPVLTHSLGASYEVLDLPHEIVDCTKPKMVIDRVMEWYNGSRPTVRGKPKFRLSTVIKEWVKLFMNDN